MEPPQYASRLAAPPQLFQGDVLERTGEIEAILERLYPYAYQNPEKYPYFVVLTQSCDLVEDNTRERKAEHITLAAVRPLHLFLEHEVAKLQTPELRELGICLTKDKQRFLNKVERLLSNEEYPFFYLHPAETTPFTEPMVAYLRVTFPLRTDSHYPVCLNAKRVELSPEFRAKLGWLTTLVFGRVATADFDPEERHKFARDFIEGIVEWRKAKALINQARQKGLSENLARLSPAQLRELVSSIDEKSHLEVVADIIAKHAREVWPQDEQQVELFRSRLLKDRALTESLSE